MTPRTPPSPPDRGAPPWYRQRWPWLLIAGPALVVVAGAITIALAVRSDDGLVADDYYKQGLAINRTIERVERSAEMNVEAVVAIAADGGVVVDLRGDGPLAAPPTIRLRVVHPTQAGADRQATLARDAAGRYVGRIDPPAAGRRQVVVETDAWRLPPVETDGLSPNVVLRGRGDPAGR